VKVNHLAMNRLSTKDPMLLVELLRKFSGDDLTRTLSRIEGSARGLGIRECDNFLLEASAAGDVLAAAAGLKRLAGQINVAIHALGILLCLPHILEADETVEYLSLGAGNAGREFDLETTYRVAEFKFIHWRGGPESIRQNSIFKDFFLLAESKVPKKKNLFVLGTKYPLKFFNGGRALTSVLSKNDKVRESFYTMFPDKFATVRDYYQSRRDRVVIRDVSLWLPDLSPTLSRMLRKPNGFRRETWLESSDNEK
jgi:hypothetical protein